MHLPRIASLGLLCVLSPVAQATAIATPLEITTGYLDWSRNFRFSVAGTKFSWEGEGLCVLFYCDRFSDGIFVYPELGPVHSKLTLGGVEYYDREDSSEDYTAIDAFLSVGLPLYPDPSQPLPSLTYNISFDARGVFGTTIDDSFDFLQVFFHGQGSGTITVNAVNVNAEETDIPAAWQWRMASAHLDFSPVPEPGTAVLFLIGMASVWVSRRCNLMARGSWGP
jgi:hypothetical protein